jgi:hypothetical protein
MPAPASYSRVLALLRRLSPVWPSTEADTSVGKELGSIATALGHAVDPLDGALDEVFPDTTDELLERWEKVCRVPTRTADDLDTRRAKVLSVLRRSSGPRLSQLAKMLAPLFDLTEEEVGFFESGRVTIDEALIHESGALNLAEPVTSTLGKPWPGTIDDMGVRVFIEVDSASGAPVNSFTLTSPEGTAWAFPATALSAWYHNRTDFLDEVAGGSWSLTFNDSGGSFNLIQWKLLVSNNIDAAQIYNFFAWRDPSLAGTPDLVEAQRLFRRTALAQMWSFVIENPSFTVDDEYSLVDRDPIGEE